MRALELPVPGPAAANGAPYGVSLAEPGPGERGEELGARRRFARIFARHRDAVRRRVRRLGVPAADADDVAQEVFVVALRRLSRLEDDEAAGVWLAALTRRVCANYRRGQARARAREAHAEPPRALPDPCAAVATREASSLLERFLDGLPECQRAAFCLQYVEGMTAREAALVLGSTPQSVQSRVRLARDKLARVVMSARARLAHDGHRRPVVG